MKTFLLAAALLFRSDAQVQESTAAQGAAVPIGVISDTVVGEDATPVGNATLSLVLISRDPKARLPKTAWTASTSADGAFRFTGLPSGNYLLCAQAPLTTWLSPCEWGPGPTALTLLYAQPTANTTITLKKGGVVPIRVDDPSGVLNQNEGKTPGAHLLLGAFNSSFGYRQASVVSSDASGRNYQILIPFGSTINIVAFSSYFNLANSLGTSLPKTGSTTPVLLGQGQAPPLLHFQITGGGN
jgi:hypothetical protein